MPFASSTSAEGGSFPRGTGAAAVYYCARGLARSERTIELGGIDLISLDDSGRIGRLIGYWDPAPLLATGEG